MLSHGLMTWMIWGRSILGNHHLRRCWCTTNCWNWIPRTKCRSDSMHGQVEEPVKRWNLHSNWCVCVLLINKHGDPLVLVNPYQYIIGIFLIYIYTFIYLFKCIDVRWCDKHEETLLELNYAWLMPPLISKAANVTVSAGRSFLVRCSTRWASAS